MIKILLTILATACVLAVVITGDSHFWTETVIGISLFIMLIASCVGVGFLCGFDHGVRTAHESIRSRFQ